MELELKRLEPVMIAIQGKEYPARMPNRAMKELAEMWQIKYFGLFQKLATDTLELDEIFDVLFVTLKAGGVNVTRDMFEDMDHDAEFINTATLKIIELFDRSQKVESALEENELGNDDKKKPEAAETPD